MWISVDGRTPLLLKILIDGLFEVYKWFGMIIGMKKAYIAFVVLLVGCMVPAIDQDAVMSKETSSSIARSFASSKPARFPLSALDVFSLHMENTFGRCDKHALGGEPSLAPPTETVPFENGYLSMQIPNNPEWGTESYSFPVYQKTNNSVHFGPVAFWKECNIDFAWFLYRESPKTFEVILKEIQEKNYLSSFYADVPANAEPSVTTINGQTVVFHEDFPECIIRYYVPRQDALYGIDMKCNDEYPDQHGIAQRLIESMVFKSDSSSASAK